MDFGFLVLSLDLEFKGKQNCQKKNAGTLPAKTSCSLFFGPMGLGETLANFFLLIFGVCSRFRETNVYEPNFATFLVISILSLAAFDFAFAAMRGSVSKKGRRREM